MTPLHPNVALLAQLARLRELMASKRWRAAYEAAELLERMQGRAHHA